MATETWVINENPTINTTIDFPNDFAVEVNGITYIGGQIFYVLITRPDGIEIENKIIRFNNPSVDIFTNGVWVSNEYKTWIIKSEIPSDLLTWLQANATKQATPKVSVDLTTLLGWSSLSSGSHNITIVAKAENYRDSEPSAAVSVTKGTQEYTDCITFTGETSDFTLAVGSGGAKEWDGTVQYSTDHNTWTTWNGTAVSSVDKKLYLRGSGNTKFYTRYGAHLSLSTKTACSGNIQTLLEYSNPPTILEAYCYRNMFDGCVNLTTAPELPATTLAHDCYYYMFQGCTSLTTAPELPATTLASYCYNSMFNGCTSLSAAPLLPATTLAGYCYYKMFMNCKSLTQAPELPATTLANACYYSMFAGCTSLKISTTQSSEYPTAWRIPSSGTISSEATSWNINMLKNTGGTFTSDPSINTTYYGAWGGTVTEDPLVGTWVFNDTLDFSALSTEDEFNFSWSINYNVSGDSRDFVLLTANRIYQEDEEGNPILCGSIDYRPYSTGVPEPIVAYEFTGDLSMWHSDSYKTITITSKLSEVTDGETLLTWLQANATKQ